jgi:hypothetical protein
LQQQQQQDQHQQQRQQQRQLVLHIMEYGTFQMYCYTLIYPPTGARAYIALSFTSPANDTQGHEHTLQVLALQPAHAATAGNIAPTYASYISNHAAAAHLQLLQVAWAQHLQLIEMNCYTQNYWFTTNGAGADSCDLHVTRRRTASERCRQ